MKLTRYLLDLINMHRLKRCIFKAKDKRYKYNLSSTYKCNFLGADNKQ